MISDAQRIGQLEGIIKNLPHDVMFSPIFENVPIEQRLEMSKLLKALVATKLQ